MLTRLHTIRDFVARDLGGIADQGCVSVEKDENGRERNGPDSCVATLTVSGKRYGLSVRSSNIAPPLGEIVCTDRQTGDLIRGEIRDHVWREIAAHIKAAANPVELVPRQAPPPAPVEPVAPPVVFSPDGRRPSIGTPVVYTPHPSQARGGVADMAGQVTKVHPDGTVAVTVFPFGGDILSIDRLPRRRSSVDFACWDFPADDMAELRAEVDELRALLDRFGMIEAGTVGVTVPGDEIEQLRKAAESAGIKIDRRWGVDRLRQEIETRKGKDAA